MDKKAYYHDYYVKHKEKALLRAKEWAKNNPDKKKVNANKYAQKNYAKNLKKASSYASLTHENDIKQLNDPYLRRQLIRYHGYSANEITDEILEVYKLTLKIKRHYNEKNNAKKR